MKPECSEYQAKIARLLLGDLTADERQALEAHLAACPQCRSEQESYAMTLSLIQSVDNEPAPRHFFVQPEEQELNPWALFRLLKPRWQAIAAAVAGLLLLAGIGGIMGFTRSSVDVAALKSDFLKSAEEQNRRTVEGYLREVRAEIALTRTDLTQQQKAELIAALDHMDSRIAGRMKLGEDRMRDDAQKMAVDVYRTVSQQRAQDLNLINLRFDGVETKNAVETQQTDAMLSTLFQVAELKLK
jgi:hypothetical protein